MSDSKNLFALTWEHYGKLINDLWVNLQKELNSKNIKIDAIVAILREGGFTALPLAYKLNTYKILTIQYKYRLFDGGSELQYVAGLQDTTYLLPESPVFLLCDTFPCGGKTKFLAIEKIKEKYPNAKFVFVSLIQDKTVESHKDILGSAYAFDVNDKWETSHPLFKELGIANDALNVCLPWENAGEEIASVEGKKWEYSN
ncbi:phosphoribosyltransferase [Candidatus Dojkabacteria bacterium]|uniref:Phosphoribosyltransferase n=1 Tax=Candidatus Dojkabacteria bacterium TaxID=2099670 RepID=A0A955I5F7_9BACT|nr:phosphoribosyltransferase [Candidatus Dojkabacteria bacterium]